MPPHEQPRPKFGDVLRATGGNFLEMFDFFLFGIYAAPIGKAFFATGNEFLDTSIAFIVFWVGALMRPLGAIYLGVGPNVQYRQDIVSVALRAVSVQSGRVLASVTTTKTVYSINVSGTGFLFAAVDKLLQADVGFTKNTPPTLAVREGIQLAVYSLIFEGVKNKLWEFKDRVAGDAFMLELEKHQKAVPPEIAAAKLHPGTVVAKY